MKQLMEYKKDRMRKVADRHRLTALIASLPENIYYMSDYESVGQRILSRTKIFSLYLPANDEVILVIPTAETPTALERFPNTPMVPFGEFFFVLSADTDRNIVEFIDKRQKNFLNALVRALVDSGIINGRVGLDESQVTFTMWKELSRALPGIDWLPAADIFSEIRLIKHKKEISLLERSAEIAEEALAKVLPEISIGSTEFEIGQRYMAEVAARGAKPYFNVITVDERSALSDTINTMKSVQDGSIIRFDFGCIYQGYCSDLARTAIFGKGDAKVRDYYRAILAGEERAMEQIKPGVSAETIFKIAVNETRKAGISHYRRHHCGHGIGLEIYDRPSIAPGVEDIFEAGMVLCIETPYYEIGWGGIQVEDTVEVTSEGMRLLNKSSRELIELGV